MYPLFITLMAVGAANAQTMDSCVQLIPDELRKTLQVRFPDERLPLTTDSREENRRYAASKGDACLLIAKGDFDGDGHADLVAILPENKAAGFRLVVAIKRKSVYMVTDLGSWPESVTDLYLDVASPGTYTHTQAYPYQPEPGSARAIDSKHEGFYFGKVDAGADVYFLTHDQWQHVHAID